MVDSDRTPIPPLFPVGPEYGGSLYPRPSPPDPLGPWGPWGPCHSPPPCEYGGCVDGLGTRDPSLPVRSSPLSYTFSSSQSTSRSFGAPHTLPTSTLSSLPQVQRFPTPLRISQDPKVLDSLRRPSVPFGVPGRVGIRETGRVGSRTGRPILSDHTPPTPDSLRVRCQWTDPNFPTRTPRRLSSRRRSPCSNTSSCTSGTHSPRCSSRATSTSSPTSSTASTGGRSGSGSGVWS